MNVREKLVELLRNSPHLDIVKGYKGNDCTFEQGADWLIAHGVTVQEWISVDDRLPEIGEIVLACGKRHATSGMFQGASIKNPKLWNWKGNTIKQVTHWMPLPHPPKGE